MSNEKRHKRPENTESKESFASVSFSEGGAERPEAKKVGDEFLLKRLDLDLIESELADKPAPEYLRSPAENLRTLARVVADIKHITELPNFKKPKLEKLIEIGETISDILAKQEEARAAIAKKAASDWEGAGRAPRSRLGHPVRGEGWVLPGFLEGQNLLSSVRRCVLGIR
ncbi:hypothetical protein ACUTUE_23485 [Bacillus sp. NA_146.1]